MNPLRRTVLKTSTVAWAVLAVSGWLRPLQAWAAEWNKPAFESQGLAEALRALGAGGAAETKEVEIRAQEIAENGASVPVEIVSRLPGTDSIAILVDKNPTALAAIFQLSPDLDARISTRIKMGETSNVNALVRAQGKYHIARKEIKITLGGCGG